MSPLLSPLIVALLSDSVTPLLASSTEIGTENGTASMIVVRVGLANGISVGICVCIGDAFGWMLNDIGSMVGIMEVGDVVNASSEGGQFSFQVL